MMRRRWFLAGFYVLAVGVGVALLGRHGREAWLLGLALWALGYATGLEDDA